MSSARRSSITKCTAFRVCGFKLLAYRTAPTVAKSTLSTKTVTSCRAIEVARVRSCCKERTSCSRTYRRFRRNSATMAIGAINRMIHAPSVNLTMEKIMTTVIETDPAIMLTMNFALQFFPLVLVAYRAMPKPARVNPVNTPRA